MTLLDILLRPGALTSMFQPIVRLRGAAAVPYAYECLTRGPAGTNLERPEVLFEYVRRKGAENVVDRACISAALRSAPLSSARARLSFNVHASTIGYDRELPHFLLKELELARIDPRGIILEIVEHSAAAGQTPPLRARIAELRRHGIAIALDDIGLGQSNYRMMLEVEPDYFKVDRHFVAGSHADPRRCAVIASLAQLARDLGGAVIGEGIEDDRDLAPLTRCGVELFQGFLFGRPFPMTDAATVRPLAEERS